MSQSSPLAFIVLGAPVVEEERQKFSIRETCSTSRNWIRIKALHVNALFRPFHTDIYCAINQNCASFVKLNRKSDSLKRRRWRLTKDFLFLRARLCGAQKLLNAFQLCVLLRAMGAHGTVLAGAE